MNPKIVSVVNHKGGCLKTTITANLGAALALAGRRVLLIDFDAQQNLTLNLLGSVSQGGPSLYEALMAESGLDDLIRETSTPGLDIVPCQEDFCGAELSLVSFFARETILKRCLEKTIGLADYDFVLIDNAPSISLVVANSLAASDGFLVPCSAEYLPMVGLSLLGQSIARLQKVAPQLKPLGVVLTLFARNERICRQVHRMLDRELGPALFQTVIRVNTKAKAAPGVQKTIFEYEGSPQGRGTEDFSKLAAEFLSRVELASLDSLEAVAHG